MKKVVAMVACLASFLVAKECATMADLINGCIKTEYNYDKKPVKQSEWKNKKEVRVIYTKKYHNNGNLKSDCRGEEQNKVCKYYDENGDFKIESRDGKPYNGKGCESDFSGDFSKRNNCGEYKDGLKNGIWTEEYKLSGYLNDSSSERAELVVQYVNGVKNGEAQILGRIRTLGLYGILESGQYLNDKKEGVWKSEYGFEGKYKEGKLIKITLKDKEYEYLGGGENIDLAEMKDYIRVDNGDILNNMVKFVTNCVETLLPDKEGKTNPNNKITSCFIDKGKKIRDGVTTISLEREYGFFSKDIRLVTYEVFFDKGKIIMDKSKCHRDSAQFMEVEKLEAMLNSGKKYTSDAYDSLLLAICR